MSAGLNLIGQRFTRLVATKRVQLKSLQRKWRCLCDCGRSVVAATVDLRRGKTKSCGCYKRDMASAGRYGLKHGKSRTRTYQSWASMKARCNNENDPYYHCYGGRGIRVCKQWIGFIRFYQDMGDRPVGKTLDRIDNNKGYSPRNCRWATPLEQTNNRR